MVKIPPIGGSIKIPIVKRHHYGGEINTNKVGILNLDLIKGL